MPFTHSVSYLQKLSFIYTCIALYTELDYQSLFGLIVDRHPYPIRTSTSVVNPNRLGSDPDADTDPHSHFHSNPVPDPDPNRIRINSDPDLT